MSKRKKSKLDENQEMEKKVNFIINIPEKEQLQDEMRYISYIKYLFTKEFKDKCITIPVKTKEKEPFKFLKQYVDLMFAIFQKKKKERIELYQSNPKMIQDYEIQQLINSLDFMVNKLKIKTQLAGMKGQVFLLNVYYLYLSQYISSINIVKHLFYFMIKDKFKEVFKTMNFDDFCPALENETCLNLILLFFENVVKGNMEILFIYALLIFKFEFVFSDFEDKIISKDILEDSAIKTFECVKKVTLSDSLIFEYTHTDYLENLRNKLAEVKYENLLYKKDNNLSIEEIKEDVKKEIEKKNRKKNKNLKMVIRRMMMK